LLLTFGRMIPQLIPYPILPAFCVVAQRHFGPHRYATFVHGDFFVLRRLHSLDVLLNLDLVRGVGLAWRESRIYGVGIVELIRKIYVL
jgi:hypothetical protein